KVDEWSSTGESLTGALTTSGNTIVNGSVGIGTASPLRALHISGASSSELIIENRQATANFRKWDLVTDGGAGTNSEFYIRQLNDAGTAGTTDFLISGGGLVALGTSSVNTSYTLTVAANAISTGWFISSDQRLKHDIKPFDRDGLAIVEGLQ